MKLQAPVSLAAALALLLSAGSASAQGTFQNPGFESASLVPISGDPYGRVQFSAAFPGWTGLIGGAQQTAALYNNVFLDTSGISIIDSGWSYPALGGGVIEGNYTAILQAGLEGATPENTTLSQTGLVPANAQSLQFKAYSLDSFGPAIPPLVVTLGGQRLTYIAMGTGTNYTLYGANVSALAGQTEDLDFTLLAQNPHVDNNYVLLDSILFSSQPTPEPSALALTALGTLLLGWHTWKRPR